mgnify:CR=1 FL=1
MSGDRVLAGRGPGRPAGDVPGARRDATRHRTMRKPLLTCAVVLVVAAGAALAAGCRNSAAGVAVAGSAPAAVPATAESAELAALPDGQAKVLIAERCLLCHSAGLISQQRKDAAAWGRTVTQMRTWGTPIQDADQAALVDYLVEHFGPAQAQR